jgi:tryptophanyl-tRNA synthetase
VILDYLGAGLDPEKCLIEVQSRVPEHTELAYYLSTIYPVSRLEDLPTYKDKKAQHPKYVNMGLLFYPVLMAADIMLYKAEKVPVGIDQEPHLEVQREIARKFNSMFGETFPEATRFKTEGEYVPSLTGEGKMSKSVEGSFITLTDDLEMIKKKLAKVPTDSGLLGGQIPQEGGVASLFSLIYLVGGKEMHHKYVLDYKDKKIRYGEMKAELSQAIHDELASFRERRKQYEENSKLVDQILDEHTERCQAQAQLTVREVRSKMGFS